MMLDVWIGLFVIGVLLNAWKQIRLLAWTVERLSEAAKRADRDLIEILALEAGNNKIATSGMVDKVLWNNYEKRS